MIEPGDTFLLAFHEEPRHLWIVVAVDRAGGECLLVSLTTLRNNKDQTVTLQPGEHPFVKRPSVVFYAQPKIWPLAALENAQRDGRAERQEPLSPELLNLVLDGFWASDHTPRRILNWLVERQRCGRKT